MELSFACVEDFRKDLHAGDVLCTGVAMLQGIGERTAKKCNVSKDRNYVSVTVSVVASLGTKPAQAEGGVLDCTQI